GARHHREYSRRSADNADAYGQERRKLESYYASRLTAAAAEASRLATQLADQQASPDPNMRRIIPATQGRFTIAERTHDDIEVDGVRRLRELDAQQVVSAATELLGVALVHIHQSTSTKDAS